jgi:hypothetical protein
MLIFTKSVNESDVSCAARCDYAHQWNVCLKPQPDALNISAAS